MVSLKDIRASNTLINDVTGPRVAVFVGGTSGVGKYTIKALVATGMAVKIYLVGRKASKEPTARFIEQMSSINPKAELIWTEGEVSLLAEVRRICEVIGKESRVDLLFLTAGYAPFGTRKETAEGLEIAGSLEYYSRMLFILHLLPLLEKAEAPRVISVLAGGKERTTINTDDLALQQPGNFGAIKAQVQYAAMNSMTMEHLANDHPSVTFIHSFPGWVNTGNMRRGPEPNSMTAWLMRLVFEPLISPFCFSADESGQRYLFQCTSSTFGGRGGAREGHLGGNSLGKQANGLFLVDHMCECTSNAEAMRILREKSQAKIWDHTQEVLGPYL